MSLTPLVLASFDITIVQAGTEVSVGIAIDQLRADVVSGVPSYNTAVTYSSTGGVYDQVASLVRWTGCRIVFDGVELGPGAFHGSVEVSESLGQPRTAKFSTIGHLWGIPTDSTLGPFTSSRSWGNKPVEIYLSFGASPRTVVEQKVFQGVTLQKSSRGDTAVLGEIGCVDDSLKSANTPLCYSLNPFGGKTRDEIVRELAVLAGFTEDQVIVPAGAPVTKPLLLTNASLMSFLTEFVSPENWVPSIDVDGNLLISHIELKDEADWILDAREGDYDLDQIEEQPPGLAPRRYYSSGTVPVGGQGVEMDTEASSTVQPYNPQCVKVRPSSLPSYLQADGSYRTLATAADMEVARVETTRTVQAGREIQRTVKTYGMFNPFARDPNYDTAPPGTSYDGAYGDHTLHVYEAEFLMEIRRETITSSYNVTGALTRRFLEVQDWHAPHVAGTWPVRTETPISVPAAQAYVFSDQTSRRYPAEQFEVTRTLERIYAFSGDSTLNVVRETVSEWLSRQSRSDVLNVDGTVYQQHNYKFSPIDWKYDVVESFLVSRETVDYYIANGGVLTDIREEITEYVNPTTTPPTDPLASPPYLFGDGTWRLFAAYDYRQSLVRTTSYREHGVGSYEITVTLFDPTTGTTAPATVQVVAGNIPGVPTAGSLMTGLVLRPMFGTLVDPALDEFVDSKKAMVMPWAETTDEISRATLRQMQRDSAIERTWKLAANPLIQVGHTINPIDPKRSIDDLELATGKTISYNTETGDCSMRLTTEAWVR